MIKELSTAENIETAVRIYVNVSANIVSHKQSHTLLSMLEFAVNNNLIPAKYVHCLRIMLMKIIVLTEWCAKRC